jgi:hypothetical protein
MAEICDPLFLYRLFKPMKPPQVIIHTCTWLRDSRVTAYMTARKSSVLLPLQETWYIFHPASQAAETGTHRLIYGLSRDLCGVRCPSDILLMWIRGVTKGEERKHAFVDPQARNWYWRSGSIELTLFLICFNEEPPNFLVEYLHLSLRIRGVPGTNIGPDTENNWGAKQFSSVSPRKWRHIILNLATPLPHNFQFNIS